MDEIDPRAYWLWLQHALGAGSSKQNRILAAYPSLKAFYEEGRESWLLEGYFTPKEMHALEAWSVEQAAALLEYSKKLGQTVITPDDLGYPELLREISNPPCALFVKGTLPDFSQRLSISIVGTRNVSDTGRMLAEKSAREAVEYGLCVISGMALGVDTMAHSTALRFAGKTIAVLGSGVDTIYPMSNKKLYQKSFRR